MILQDKYGPNPEVVGNLDDDEAEELMGALLSLREQLRKLQWFGEVNRRGFVKITKKLDKKVPGPATQQSYIATKVDLKPFAKDTTTRRQSDEVSKWIAVLGSSQQVDDNKSDRSVRSTKSLGRATAKAKLNIPEDKLDQLDKAIQKKDVKGLEDGLKAAVNLNDTGAQVLLRNLLQRSISARFQPAIGFLLGHIKSLEEPSDINGRNCIHRLVIHIGRALSGPPVAVQEPGTFPFPKPGAHYGQNYLTPAASPLAAPRLTQIKESTTNGGVEEASNILGFVLDKLSGDQKEALSAKDSFDRIPLHYAAQFGFPILCKLLISKMQEWGQFNVENGVDSTEWQDKDGYAPLHLSVIGGHPKTTALLLKGADWQRLDDGRPRVRRNISKSSAVLAIATKHNYFNIVKMLVDAGVDINWQDSEGETALHVAARLGHEQCAQVLLGGNDDQKIDLELTEKPFGWTPLHIAAVDGHLHIANLLVQAGVDVDIPDSGGWTAREHAALRGHLPIARLLLENSRAEVVEATVKEEAAKALPGTAPPETNRALEDRHLVAKSKATEIPPPIKSYGHRYLKDETMVLVSLGSMDMRKNLQAVKLRKVPLADAHHTQLDTALSVVVSATGAQGESTMIDLPVHDNISTEPMVFTTQDVSQVKVMFDIVPTYSGNTKNKVGRGVALLSHVRPDIGAKRMNLQGDVCVPIMGSDLEIIGTVNFNFLIITPFAHPNMEVTSKLTYWKKMASTMVIGHRGLGKNLASGRSLQLGENTVESFIAAANLGAEYVEFDVQLTKDHVPVIYHDFLVSETGFDAPVHTLTLEQFLHLNPDKNRKNPPTTPDQESKHHSSPPARRGRSLSMGVNSFDRTTMDERMKHTRDFKEKGYKGNSRGNFIQAPFATLEQLFKELPAETGFNIEMKYPMLFESEEHDMDTYAIELNSFCDTILQMVYDRAGNRNILFSSFNPDICLCLSFKQPNYPIMFLTDAGGCPVGDVRASSLQEAIRFASRWNLLGIVSLSEPFVNSPRLIRIVKQSGLVCVSYGAQNNDPVLVQVSLILSIFRTRLWTRC